MHIDNFLKNRRCIFVWFLKEVALFFLHFLSVMFLFNDVLNLMTACSCGQTETFQGPQPSLTVTLSHLPCLVSRHPCSSTHLSRLSLWANILQSFPLVCGASRLPHNFCRMETGMRKALGPTSVVMLLAGSSKDVSILWESCRRREETEITTCCMYIIEHHLT